MNKNVGKKRKFKYRSLKSKRENEMSWKSYIKCLLTTFHMKMINRVALGRPVIMNTDFVKGITLSNETKNAYIFNNVFGEKF